MWIRGEVMLFVDPNDGSKMVTVKNLSRQESSGLPRGWEVNVALTNSNSELRQRVQRVLNGGGVTEIGPMRVLNGGGCYTLPAGKFDLVCAAGSHAELWRSLSQKLGGEPETATPVVFRDWGAPGTFGVFDGGGAGRGESIPLTASEFLVKQCLGENLGEIGLLSYWPDDSVGRIGYRLGSLVDYKDALEPWLDAHVAEEWQKAHGFTPPVHATASVEFARLPDSMYIGGVGNVANIKLAFEWASASLECLTMSNLTFPDSADPTRRGVSFRLRCIDLESRKGGGLNRPIGIVLQRGDQFAVIQYRNGVFDHNSPMIPVCAETLPMIGNEKFHAVIEMLRAQR